MLLKGHLVTTAYKEILTACISTDQDANIS